MGEHTKLPWKLDGTYITNEDPNDVRSPSIADCGRSPTIDRKTQISNAAFIVEAVNNHDRLIGALQEAVLQLEYMQERMPTGTGAAVLARSHSLLSSLKKGQANG